MLNLAQFEKAMKEHYPETRHWVNDPYKSYRRLCVECNYLEAVKLINWNKYLTTNSIILDLAGGIGWLSAYLSKIERIQQIYFLDSSRFYIEEMMPNLVEIMNGVKSKIDSIEGFFTPLLFEDDSLDLVVASSALHHAENLEDVLKEIRRVLKANGYLFILNETPLPAIRYQLVLLKQAFFILMNTVLRNYRSKSPFISSSGTLYDPMLGDKVYPLWFWEKALILSGFHIESIINTGLPTVKGKDGIFLKHFVCQKGNDTLSDPIDGQSIIGICGIF